MRTCARRSKRNGKKPVFRNSSPRFKRWLVRLLFIIMGVILLSLMAAFIIVLRSAVPEGDRWVIVFPLFIFTYVLFVWVSIFKEL